MNFNHTISAILRGIWMIDPAWAHSQIPLIANILLGNQSVERTGSSSFEKPFVVNPSTMERMNYKDWDENYNYGVNPKIENGSVGVIPFNTAITKYNGECGEPGAIAKASDLIEMQKASKITSIILLLDTPGGEARAANIITDPIKKSKKPVLSFVNGYAASLGMFPLTAAHEAYASNESDKIGSVGTYVQLADFSGFFESKGIKLHEVYAPQSTDKNKDYRDALAGDYTEIEKDLEKITASFINHIKTHRPAAAAKESAWNTGKMFYAEEAKKLGLIDGIKSFDQVVSKAAWLAKRN